MVELQFLVEEAEVGDQEDRLTQDQGDLLDQELAAAREILELVVLLMAAVAGHFVEFLYQKQLQMVGEEVRLEAAVAHLTGVGVRCPLLVFVC